MKPVEIADQVWVFTSALYQTTSTVIRTRSEILVVDPNWLPEEVLAIRMFVEEVKGHRKCYMLFTHSDYDHIIGYGAFTADHVIASRAFVDSTHKDADIAEAIKFDADRGIQRPYKISYPAADIIVADDAREVLFDGMKLCCYLAPGHTPEGMFTLIEPGGILLAGDYLSDVEFPLIDHISTYRKTLAKVGYILSTHKIRRLIPGHGRVADDQQEIRRRICDATEYLDDLEAHVLGSEFPDARYEERYPAWDSLQEWHVENVRRAKSQTPS